MALRFMQHFHLCGPRCDWPGCSKLACAFYARDNGSAMALCSLHVRELAEVGEIQLDQDSCYPPHLPVFSEADAKSRKAS